MKLLELLSADIHFRRLNFISNYRIVFVSAIYILFIWSFLDFLHRKLEVIILFGIKYLAFTSGLVDCLGLWKLFLLLIGLKTKAAHLIILDIELILFELNLYDQYKL